MATLQDSDLMVVGRGSTPYKITGKEVKDSLGGGGGGGGIFPSENDLAINPSVPGSGTLEDPYVLTTRTAAPAGSTVSTSETITFTEQPPNTDVIWTDNSTGSGTRFSQPVTKTDANGTWSAELQYADAPDSTEDVDYTGNLQIGTLHFRWQVDQKLNDRIPTDVVSVNLVDTGLEDGPRFTDQSFVFTSVVTDGAPLPTKTIEAHVDGSIRITPESSDIVATEDLFLEQPTDINWNATYNSNFTIDSVAHTASKDGNAAGTQIAEDFIDLATLDTTVRVEYTVEVISGSYSVVGFGNVFITPDNDYVGQTSASFGFQIWEYQDKITTIGGNATLVPVDGNNGNWSFTNLPNGVNTNGIKIWLDVKPQRKFDLYVSGVYLETFTIEESFGTMLYPAIGTNGNGPETIQIGGPGISATKLTLANDSGLSNFSAGDAVVQDSGFGPVTSEIVGVGTETNDGSIYQGGTVTGDTVYGNWNNIFDNPDVNVSKNVYVQPSGSSSQYTLPTSITATESLEMWMQGNGFSGQINVKEGNGIQGAFYIQVATPTLVPFTLGGANTYPITFDTLILSTGSNTSDVYAFALIVDGVPFGSDLTKLTLADNKDLDKFVAGDLVQQDSSITALAPAFSTTLYDGSDNQQTIDTGIDLIGSGGLVWIKNTDGSQSHALTDTVRGANNILKSDTTGEVVTGGINSFNNSSYILQAFATNGNNIWTNQNGRKYVSWNFRVAPKFFDIQTWTGTDGQPRVLDHNLTTTPGCIIFKANSNSQWFVYHKELGLDKFIYLNQTAASLDSAGAWNSMTASTFGFGTNAGLNNSGKEFVAYLFADEPGVIKCGSYEGISSGKTVDCGFEPGWVMLKSTTLSGDYSNWYMNDDKRNNGISNDTLGANLGKPENGNNLNGTMTFTATGFTVDNTGNPGFSSDGESYIYVAISKDPMADATVLPAGLFQSTDGNTITLTPQTDGWQANQGTKALGPTTTASGTVSSIDGSTMTIAGSEGTWTPNADKYVVGEEKIVANARQYLKFDSSGNVTDMQSRPQDPPYTTTATNPSLTLTFPSTFPSGETPDDELPEGTTLSVGIASENSANRSPVTGYEEATVQPKGVTDIDAVFKIMTYTGDASASRDILTDLNMTAGSGLVWTKTRTPGYGHCLVDTIRGAGQVLDSSSPNKNINLPDTVRTFGTGGYNIGNYVLVNNATSPIVSWSFLRAPKFFDVQTWTGTDNAARNIPHDLETIPGLILVKETNEDGNWRVYSKTLGAGGRLFLNGAEAADPTGSTYWGDTEPTDTEFTVGQGTNGAGVELVAYLFADDTPGLIKCGSYTGTGSNQTIDCGFKPQWVMIKGATIAGDWKIADTARGFDMSPTESLDANGSSAANEVTSSYNWTSVDNGFTVGGSLDVINKAPETYLYVAIAAPVIETMTAEQFTESQAKFLTYDNRKQVKEGEEALDNREQVIAEADNLGLDLGEIKRMFDK